MKEILVKLTELLGKLVFISIAIAVVSACSHSTRAPVYDVSSHTRYDKSSKSLSIPKAGHYVVKPGDTLFSIAWMYSLDVQQLAKINRLKNNLIYPGQKLTLKYPSSKTYFDPKSLKLALNREVLKRPVNLKTYPKVRAQRSSQITQRVKKSKVGKVAKSKSRAPAKKAIAKSHSFKESKKLNWIWPANGKLLRRFSDKSNASRGVDIAGVRGQPVRATAPGQVVYEGNGLRGYGNLVIIKHNNNYLSAYAHNEKVHVSENEVVKAGQRIADIGSSGANREQLHFEIRYKGKPVDPLNYLPEKKF